MSAGDWLITLLPPDVEKQFTDFLQKRNQNPETPGPNDATPPDNGDNGDNTDSSASSAPADAASSAPGA
jgi:hypothetical protein